MAGPAIVVVAGFVTAWLAVRSNDGLVEDDYYKQGLAVSHQLERSHTAAAHGLSAELVAGADGRELRLFLSVASGTALPDVVRLLVVHPTRSGADQSLQLTREAAGYYSGRLGAPLHGRWHLALEDEARNWRIVGDWNPDVQPGARLMASVSN